VKIKLTQAVKAKEAAAEEGKNKLAA